MPVSVRRNHSQKSPPRTKRNVSVRRTNSFSLLARPSKPGDRLTVEVLHSLTPYKNGLDVVSEAARSALLNAVKMEPHVHDTFFPNEIEDTVLENVDARGFPIDKLATALVAQNIAWNKDNFKFHQMLEKSAIEDVLVDLYNSLQWKKLGFCLYTLVYPDGVKDDKTGVCLRDFIEDNGHVWAEKLLAYIMEPRWTKLWMFRIVRGLCSEDEYNKEMNVLFVKLHLLDPQSVIPAFQFLLNQRALPSVNLELATRNYLGGPLDYTLINIDVQEAINKTSVPVNVSKLSLSDVEIYHGADVDVFIVTECRNIGVWNDRRPENTKTSKVQDRCIIM